MRDVAYTDVPVEMGGADSWREPEPFTERSPEELSFSLDVPLKPGSLPALVWGEDGGTSGSSCDFWNAARASTRLLPSTSSLTLCFFTLGFDR